MESQVPTADQLKEIMASRQTYQDQRDLLEIAVSLASYYYGAPDTSSWTTIFDTAEAALAEYRKRCDRLAEQATTQGSELKMEEK